MYGKFCAKRFYWEVKIYLIKGLKSKYIRLRYDHSMLKGSHLEVYMGHHHRKINQMKGLKSKDIWLLYEYIKPHLVTY